MEKSEKLSRFLGKIGTVVCYTIIRVPPADFVSSAPYAVAIVELEDGQKIVAQVADYDLKTDIVGAKARVVIRRVSLSGSDDVIPYGMKVKILE